MKNLIIVATIVLGTMTACESSKVVYTQSYIDAHADTGECDEFLEGNYRELGSKTNTMIAVDKAQQNTFHKLMDKIAGIYK